MLKDKLVSLRVELMVSTDRLQVVIQFKVIMPFHYS